MKVSLVEFQRLVFGTGRIVEELASARHRRLVGGAVDNEHRQFD